MGFAAVLLYLFVGIVVIQLGFYLLFLFSFSIKKEMPNLNKQLPVTVILCAKNEAQNLRDNLPLIINQDYSNFEVLLINDSSKDETLEVMNSFKSSYNHVSVVDVKTNETFWGNKKYALTLGIKASKNNTLVFTDADCKPNSRLWLAHLCGKFNTSIDIVLGYGAYAKKKWSFLNKLIRYETVLTALQYFSYATLKSPYMGVGRNIAYKKELFFNNNGFNSHVNLKSGDDDLFINEVANNTNTTICTIYDSFTISVPKLHFKDWVLQKRRHISTANYYKLKHRLSLGLFYLSQLLFWVLAATLLIISAHWPLILGLILLRFTVQLLSFGFSAKKLNENDLVLLAPLLELFLILSQLSIFIANLISKPKHWK